MGRIAPRPRPGAPARAATARARAWRRATLVGLGTLIALAAPAPPAHAENSIVSSSPEDGSVVDVSPTSLVITFAEPLGPTNNVVASCNGNTLPLGAATVGEDDLTLTIAVPNPMPRGTCRVSAIVSAPDSTGNGGGSFSFEVRADAPAPAAPTVPAGGETTTAATLPGAAAPTVPAPATAAADDEQDDAPRVGGPLGVSRLAATLGLAVLLGALVLIVAAWPEGVEYILTVRFLRTAWIVGIAGSFLTMVLLAAQRTGRSVGASFGPAAWIDLAGDAPGAAAVARVVLALACGWVVARPERVIDPATQLAALGVPALAVATFGFSRTGGDLAAVGVVMGIVHALAMAVWLGGIVLLTRVVLAGPGEDDLVHATRGFGRIAMPALVVTVLTGVVQMIRLDSGELFDSGHGRVLVLKSIAVAAVVFVGVATRQFVQSRLTRADSMTAPLATRLRRATGIEAAGGVVILALSAWLLALTPPGLEASDGADPGRLGYTDGRIVIGDLDVNVSLTGAVGPNAVEIEINSPPTGLSQMTVELVPPAGSAASGVLITVPPEITGAARLVLPIEQGVPIEVPGVWTLRVRATTPTGVLEDVRTFTIADDDA